MTGLDTIARDTVRKVLRSNATAFAYKREVQAVSALLLGGQE